MFTGIVRAVGHIVAVERRAAGCRILLDPDPLPVGGLRIGDSLCVSGACLTVADKRRRRLAFDVSPETLARTVHLDRPGPVNLEPALTAGAPLGGHLVTGHVDGVGTVLAFADGVLRVRAPRVLARYLAPKGSVAVDGVSLTVNRVRGAVFEVYLIPHTRRSTTLGALGAGARVNLEADLVARYLERLVARRRR